MNINEKDLSQLNQIDMECKSYDDNDSFGNITVTSPKNSSVNNDEIPSNYNPNTGVIINLSDDEDVKPMKHISVNMEDDGLRVKRDFNSELEINSEGYNQIDMETDYYDDTEDEDYWTNTSKAKSIEFEEHENGNNLKSSKAKTILDFDDDSEELLNGLIDEDMLEEKKKITQGDVEADYWKKLQKKHAATNKKGAYNTHFHFSANPKAEAEMFNNDMKPVGPIPNATNINGTTSFEGESSFGGGEGCCESLEEENATKILNNLFDLIGFEVIANSDGSLNAFDLCNKDNDLTANNLSNLIDQLHPYINSCLICPLEVKTGKSFDNYYDWCDWYNENKEQYPELAEDIKYCDVLGNRLADCYF